MIGLRSANSRQTVRVLFRLKDVPNLGQQFLLGRRLGLGLEALKDADRIAGQKEHHKSDDQERDDLVDKLAVENERLLGGLCSPGPCC